MGKVSLEPVDATDADDAVDAGNGPGAAGRAARHGQVKGDRRADAGSGIDENRPAHPLNRRKSGGEAKALRAAARGKVGLENAGNCLLRYAMALVLDVKADVVADF